MTPNNNKEHLHLSRPGVPAAALAATGRGQPEDTDPRPQWQMTSFALKLDYLQDEAGGGVLLA